MLNRRRRAGVLVAAASLVVISTVIPPPASAATATVTIKGRSHWVLYIDALSLASGYRAYCARTNGAVKLWGGRTPKLLATISRSVTQLSHTTYSDGSQSWICAMPFSITVSRHVKYAIGWANGTPYENVGCTNSKSVSDAKIWRDDPTKTTYKVPVISFTYLC